MTADQNKIWPTGARAIWARVRSNKFVAAIIWARWIITVAGFVATLGWYAYVEGQNISENLSTDYKAVQTAQATLIDDSLVLIADILNPNETIELDQRLSELRKQARATVGALGGLRAPTAKVEVAQQEYRAALELLIGVANRIERGEVEGMAQPLHNSLQAVANYGGAFNTAVSGFQGGMLPQLLGSIT